MIVRSIYSEVNNMRVEKHLLVAHRDTAAVALFLASRRCLRRSWTSVMASSRGSGLRLPIRGSFFVETAVAVTSEGLPDEKSLELVGCHEPDRANFE